MTIIFQPYMNESEIKLLDSNFTPFDNTKNEQSHLREYPLLLEVLKNIDSLPSDLVGFFSPKFTKKTFLDSNDVFEFIKANPGYDIYLFNPYPQNDVLFYNMWEEAEYQHPKITEITECALKNTHGKILLNKLGRSENKTVYCNFWVASKNFWAKYFDFLIPLANFMMDNPGQFFKKTSYYIDDSLPYFPFIIERLVSTYLMLTNWNIKAYQYPDDMLDQLMVHELQREAYKTIHPITKDFDNRYGTIWPNNAKIKLKNIREKTFNRLLKAGYRMDFRC